MARRRPKVSLALQKRTLKDLKALKKAHAKFELSLRKFSRDLQAMGYKGPVPYFRI